MHEWLQQTWKKSKNPFVRVGALFLLILLGTLGLVSKLSDTGFAQEVQDSRRVIWIGSFCLATVLAAAILLWGCPRFRRSLESLKKSIQGKIRAAAHWVRSPSQLVVGLILLFGVSGSYFALTQSPWAVVLTMAFACALLLLARSFHLTPQRRERRHRYRVLPLPVGKVANARLESFYSNPPSGEVDFGGVKFLLQPGVSVLDTKECSWTESDGSKRIRLELSKPAGHVESVHLLINASGGWKAYADGGDRVVLEWSKIGTVELTFGDETFQSTDLILGDNVREWAIGNDPGNLVDRTADSLSRVAWKGETIQGKYSVIDQLEIPVLESNKRKELECITFVRDAPQRPSLLGKPFLHFLVFAVTLELGQPH